MDPLLTFLLGLTLGVLLGVSAMGNAFRRQQQTHLRERMYLVRQFSGKLDAVHEDVLETAEEVSELRGELELVEEEDEDDADWWKTGENR